MVCRVERHVEEEAKKLSGWREFGGEQRLALVTVAKKMGHAALYEKPFTRREHAPLAIHHQLQLTLFDDEFLVRVGMKVLPAGPGLHSADFNENIALKLTCAFVGRGFMTFCSIAVPSPDKGRELRVSKFPAGGC